MIIRCDDAPQSTTVETFQEVLDVFKEHGKILTLSILANGLKNRQDFVDWVNDNRTMLDLTLHGWSHEQYPLLESDHIVEHICRSFAEFYRCFGVLPKDWYLPWNGWDKENGFSKVPRVHKIAQRYNLRVNQPAEHMGVVLKGEKPYCVYFHAWDKEDIKLLPKVLEKL